MREKTQINKFINEKWDIMTATTHTNTKEHKIWGWTTIYQQTGQPRSNR